MPQLTALIIEDEPRLRDLYHDLLKSWDVRSIAAKSGEEALRVIDSRDADFLIIDLNLPGMGGLDCLRTIRDRGIDWPAMIVTGFGDLSAAQEAIRLGVVEFLTKPISMAQLEQAISRVRLNIARTLPEPEKKSPTKPTAAPVTLEEIERVHILETLSRHAGNRTTTAQELAISRRTLQYRLQEYQRQGYLAEDE